MQIKIDRQIPCLRIHCVFNNRIIASNGYNIYSSQDLGISWRFDVELPIRKFNNILYSCRLLSRLLRKGISKIVNINDERLLIFCEGKIYLSNSSISSIERVSLDTCFYQILDNNICVIDRYIYYGEYFPNYQKRHVNIFRTKDCYNWEKIYSFPPGRVRHIHLLQFDPYLKRLWFSTGDLGKECTLGLTDLDFSDLEYVGGNNQIWRTLELVFSHEKVFWGMEDPSGINWIVSLDRNSNILRKIIKVGGPIYNFKKIGHEEYILLSANERGEWDRRAHLWHLNSLCNGVLNDELSYEKDQLPSAFGFGRFIFGTIYKNRLFLYCIGLKNVDDKTLVFNITD